MNTAVNDGLDSDTAATAALLLRVRDLVKHFPSGGGWLGPPRRVVHAVNQVSFDVPRGTAVGLVGESGCGKSTVARSLLRLIEPDAGSILFDGIDIRTIDAASLRRLRQRMQIVFQDPYASLNPRRTIRQALTEPLVVHGRGDKTTIAATVTAAIEEVGLPQGALDRYPHEFSGGQRQRIGIARALVLGPDLIVADEPVSALDVSVQAQILQLLTRLRERRGLSFVFVSHDLGVIRYFCDTACVMYLGRIVESGPAARLLDRPRHPYSRLLRDASPIPDPQVRIPPARIEGEIPAPTDLPSGCAFHPRCPRATDTCRKHVPALENMGDGTRAACFHPLP